MVLGGREVLGEVGLSLEVVGVRVPAEYDGVDHNDVHGHLRARHVESQRVVKVGIVPEK